MDSSMPCPMDCRDPATKQEKVQNIGQIQRCVVLKETELKKYSS